MSYIGNKQTPTAPEYNSSSESNQDVPFASSTSSAPSSPSVAYLNHAESKFNPKLYRQVQNVRLDENAAPLARCRRSSLSGSPRRSSLSVCIRTRSSAPKTCRRSRTRRPARFTCWLPTWSSRLMLRIRLTSSTSRLRLRQKAPCFSGITRTARTRGATRPGSPFARPRVDGSV